MTNLNIMQNFRIIAGSRTRTPLTGVAMFFAKVGEAVLDAFGYISLNSMAVVGLGTIVLQFSTESALHTFGIAFADTIGTIFRMFDIIVVSTIGLIISAFLISQKAEDVVSLYSEKRSQMSSREKLMTERNTKHRLMKFVADTYSLELEQ